MIALRLRRQGRNEGQGARTRELLHRAGWSEPLRADRAKPVVLYIHGFGPTDTHYIDQAADPRPRPNLTE